MVNQLLNGLPAGRTSSIRVVLTKRNQKDSGVGTHSELIHKFSLYE